MNASSKSEISGLKISWQPTESSTNFLMVSPIASEYA
jgi:hypothetical protein